MINQIKKLHKSEHKDGFHTTYNQNNKEETGMDINTRSREIENELHSCSKKWYKRDEILPELMALQDEVIRRTPNVVSAVEGRGPQLWDVYNKLEELNREKNGIATKELQAFKDDCKDCTNYIKGIISGYRGETWTFRKLDGLKVENRVMKNVALSNERYRTEIDAVVLTHKGAFIIEIKNTKRDVFIDERGQYYRTGEFLQWDSDIGYKTRVKTHLLRMKLNEEGYRIPVTPIILFSNDTIHVQNKCSELTTCFMKQLSFLIEDFDSDEILTDQDMDSIAEELGKIVGRDVFPIKTDTAKLKKDYAMLMAKLEMADKLTTTAEKAAVDQNRQAGTTGGNERKRHPVLEWLGRVVRNLDVRGSVEDMAAGG